MTDKQPDAAPDLSDPQTLQERIVAAAVAWYQAKVTFSSVRENTRPGIDVGIAEEELRLLCHQYLVVRRCNTAPDSTDTLVATRRELLLGPPNERPASFYPKAGNK